MIQLGLGLIGIGREWGVANTSVPEENMVFELLDEAYTLGIRYFNTAPAYGHSEERFGKWYKQLSTEQKNNITIATKFGEFWNFETNSPYRNYSFENLQKSIDRSLELLEKINIIQVHGFTKEIWEENAEDIHKAFEYAKSLGIEKMGASLSKPDGAEVVLNNEVFKVVQFPHNLVNRYEKSVIEDALSHNKDIVVNRPFAMGEIAQQSAHDAKLNAYKFVINDIRKGTILTGTKSIEHLKENLSIFKQAKEELGVS